MSSFNVRIPSAIFARLRVEAQARGLSVHAWAAVVVARALERKQVFPRFPHSRTSFESLRFSSFVHLHFTEPDFDELDRWSLTLGQIMADTVRDFLWQHCTKKERLAAAREIKAIQARRAIQRAIIPSGSSGKLPPLKF